MGIFKRLKALEDQNISMSKHIAAIESKLQQLENKLPDYEAAVEREANDVLTRVANDIMNFYPGMKTDGDSR